jgi:hypothetical protein
LRHKAQETKVALLPIRHPTIAKRFLRFILQGGFMVSSGLSAAPQFSRRNFLARTSQWSALLATYQSFPLPALAESLARDSRVAQTPVVDKGFASVRKVGEGLYATISDTSKGLQTMCNGGFLIGKDAALLLEGFVSPAGASFQHETLRTLSQGPIMGALDTHYHFDHTTGNSFYGANGISLWGHAGVSKRIFDSYGAMQGVDKAAFLAPLEARKKIAKTDAARKHAAELAATMGNIFGVANSSILAFSESPARSCQASRQTRPRRLDGTRRNSSRPLRNRPDRARSRTKRGLHRRSSVQPHVSGYV